MNSLINCPVVVLCGGKSSRMGSDKSLLPFNEYDTLTEYQYRKLQKIFKEVYISSKEDKFDFLEDKTKLILDTNSTYSPMVALEKILKSFSNSFIFIIAVDIPLLQKNTIEKLHKSTKSDYEIIVPLDSNGNRHNLCGFYHTSVLRNIDKLLKEEIHKIGALIQISNSKQLQINNQLEFLNLNDKQEYQKACKAVNSF